MRRESADIVLCREVLKKTFERVQEHFPEIEYRHAWVYNYRDGRWDFHGPEKFYWYGKADNAYDARAQGWQAFLEHKGIDE